MHKVKSIINPFVPYAPFLDPLKTSENRKVFCFHVLEKGCIGNEWVKLNSRAKNINHENWK